MIRRNQSYCLTESCHCVSSCIWKVGKLQKIQYLHTVFVTIRIENYCKVPLCAVTTCAIKQIRMISACPVSGVSTITIHIFSTCLIYTLKALKYLNIITANFNSANKQYANHIWAITYQYCQDSNYCNYHDDLYV